MLLPGLSAAVVVNSSPVSVTGKGTPLTTRNAPGTVAGPRAHRLLMRPITCVLLLAVAVSKPGARITPRGQLVAMTGGAVGSSSNDAETVAEVTVVVVCGAGATGRVGGTGGSGGIGGAGPNVMSVMLCR